MKNKKKKNSGFTLIELLAVVVILLAITVMAISSISAAIERNKNKQNETRKAVLKSYAELYYQDHKNTCNRSGCISISKLLEKGIVNQEEAQDADGDLIAGGFTYNNGEQFTYNNICTHSCSN